MNIQVLIIERNDLDCFAMYKELRIEGYQVNFTRVDSIKEFKAEILSYRWNVIIINVDTTTLGLDTISTYMKNMKINIPIIVISQDKSSEAKEDAYATGAYSYVYMDQLFTLGTIVSKALANGYSAHLSKVKKSSSRSAKDSENTADISYEISDMIWDMDVILKNVSNVLTLITETLPPDSRERQYAHLALQATYRGDALLQSLSSQLDIGRKCKEIRCQYLQNKQCSLKKLGGILPEWE